MITTKKTLNLSKLILPYAAKKLWIALSPDNKKVVGSGKTIKEAIEKAKKNKIERPTILQAIPDYSGFVPLLK